MKKNICSKFFLLTLITFMSANLQAQVTDSTKAADTAIRQSTSFAPKKRNKPVAFIVPAVLMGYGFVSLDSKYLRDIDRNLNEDIRKSSPGFSTKADDYLRFVPMAAVYGLNWAGVKGKNDFFDRSATVAISYVIMGSSLAVLKSATHRLRPNGSAYTSFPSGHTAIAFAGAELMAQEYGEASVWYPVAAYTVASATGAIRMYNHAHWLSDVVAGAGLGIVSTKVAYLVYPYVKHKIFHDKEPKIFAAPMFRDKAAGLSLIKTF